MPRAGCDLYGETHGRSVYPRRDAGYSTNRKGNVMDYTCFKCNGPIGRDQTSVLMTLPIGKRRMHVKTEKREGVNGSPGCQWWYAKPVGATYPSVPQTRKRIPPKPRFFKTPIGGKTIWIDPPEPEKPRPKGLVKAIG